MNPERVSSSLSEPSEQRLSVNPSLPLVLEKLCCAPALGDQSSILYLQVAPVCAAGTVSTCRKKSSFQILQVNKQTAPTGYENKVANRLDHSGFHGAAVLGHLQAEGAPLPPYITAG